VAEGGGGVTTTLAFLSDFKDAIDFILHSRESVAGTVRVGGLDEMLTLTWRHTWVSLLAVGIACLISMPIGLWLGHRGKGQFLAINISNVGRAVPSLALLAFFIAYLGVGLLNLTVVLLLLAIPPILTNTYIGTTQVDRDAVDASRGMGMSDGQIIRKVELPLALPTIFGGIRIAAVNVFATATIAPLASVDTLGRPIISANVYGGTGRLAAAILVALLTLAAYYGLGLVQRAVTPKGIKLAAEREERPRWSRFHLRRRLKVT
jgi:osmoprotectant transport system permease protein